MDSDRLTVEGARREHSKIGLLRCHSVVFPENISVTPHFSCYSCCCCEKIPQPNKTKATLTKRDLLFQKFILASVSRLKGESILVRDVWQHEEEATGPAFPST